MLHYGDQTIRQRAVSGANRVGKNKAMEENTKGRNHRPKNIAEEALVFTT